MNKKLKIALILRSSEQGFALPITVAMGVIMILISTTLLMRSQSDNVMASVQKNAAQSLLLSEVGVTRTQAFLKQYPSFRTQNYNSTTNGWNSASSLLGGPGTNGQWIPLPEGSFQVLEYTPPTAPSTDGTLKVKGRTSQGATSSLSVKISTTTLGITEWQRQETPDV